MRQVGGCSQFFSRNRNFTGISLEICTTFLFIFSNVVGAIDEKQEFFWPHRKYTQKNGDFTFKHS